MIVKTSVLHVVHNTYREITTTSAFLPKPLYLKRINHKNVLGVMHLQIVCDAIQYSVLMFNLIFIDKHL